MRNDTVGGSLEDTPRCTYYPPILRSTEDSGNCLIRMPGRRLGRAGLARIFMRAMYLDTWKIACAHCTLCQSDGLVAEFADLMKKRYLPYL